MKLTLKTESLRGALNNTVINAKMEQLIYAHALFNWQGDNNDVAVAITTINSHEELIVFIDGQSDRNISSFTANISQIKSALTGIDTDTVELRLNESNLTLHINGRRYRIDTLPVNTFPKLPEDDKGTLLDLDATALLKGIALVQYCRDKTNDATICSGICLDVGNIVATDKTRIAVAPCRTGLKKPIVIPGQSLNAIAKTVTEISATHLFKTNGVATSLRFTSDDFMLTTRLMGERFPDWRKAVIDHSNSDFITKFNGSDLSYAIKRTTPFSLQVINSKKFQRITIESGNKKLRLACPNGNADDFIKCYYADEFTLDINAIFLAEMISVVGQNQITWHSMDNGNVQVFTAENHDATHYIAKMH